MLIIINNFNYIKMNNNMQFERTQKKISMDFNNKLPNISFNNKTFRNRKLNQTVEVKKDIFKKIENQRAYLSYLQKSQENEKYNVS